MEYGNLGSLLCLVLEVLWKKEMKDSIDINKETRESLQTVSDLLIRSAFQILIPKHGLLMLIDQNPP